MKKLLPNFLTISRIFLIPVFWWCLVGMKEPWNVLYSMIIFIIASITDYYDGKFARKYNVTNFGKIMDPIADKGLIGVAFYLLTIPPFSLVSLWPLFVVLFREFLVTALRSYYIKKNIFIPANFWGKLKTGTQIGVVIAAFVFQFVEMIFNLPPSVSNILDIIIIVAIWITVLITIASGVTYFFGEKK